MVTVDFCREVGLIMTDMADPNQADWMGWSYGELAEFDYNEMLPISRPPNVATPPSSGTPTASDDTEREFTQVYRFGDKGWPCRRPEGRTAFVHLWCDDTATANCLDIPGTASPYCSDNTTMPSTSPCICNIDVDLIEDPCRINVNVLMHDCPDQSLIPLSPLPPNGSAPTGGEIFGIIVLVLFLICIVSFGGGCVYNYYVGGKRGIEILPFGGVFRTSPVKEGYQPAPNASYGSIEPQSNNA